MDTRQLRAFCAVVELKSFSQAADRLGVTQPAVSLQVRSLEKRLDRRLLDRSGRRVEPTEAGLALYRGAQRILQFEEQLVEELEAGEDGELGGTLAVGAFSPMKRYSTTLPSRQTSCFVGLESRCPA